MEVICTFQQSCKTVYQTSFLNASDVTPATLTVVWPMTHKLSLFAFRKRAVDGADDVPGWTLFGCQGDEVQLQDRHLLETNCLRRKRCIQHAFFAALGNG